ncbi:hypothetical protein L2E82_47686 [Cichorium intybus]|uniref:Uncharacterized protein n=1 Tax=Cichorium intybus TaxID=13427 RepID=A0ACB8YW82_CICIN|nr:hypothetical protein L2E82_47686 [Cichorium intybus]
MPSPTDNPVDLEGVDVVDIEPPTEVYHQRVSSAIAFLSKCIRYLITLLEGLGRLSMEYYPPIFGAIILPSPLKFIIIGLAAFAEMKSQGSEFPFKTHPRSMNVAITSLLVYGLASAAEHFISATRLGPTSVYAIVAHSGRIGLEALGSADLIKNKPRHSYPLCASNIAQEVTKEDITVEIATLFF